MIKKSEIYKLGYEKWEGKRMFALPTWFLIGESSLKNVIGSSGWFGRLVFLIGFSAYYTNILFASFAYYQSETLKQYDFFRSILETLEQSTFEISTIWLNKNFILNPSIITSVFMMLFFGSQLISKDKRANALQVYFSKAVSRIDYTLGKYMAVSVFTATVTLVPCFLILAMGFLFTNDYRTFLMEAWYIPFLTGGYWLFLTLVFGSITLYFSSLFSKSYMAAVAIIGFQLLAFAFSKIMALLVGDLGFFRGIDWMDSLKACGKAIFNFKVESWPLLSWQVIDLVLIIAVCSWLTFRNIRPVEVIK